MSPFLQQIVGTLVRAALVWLSAWLAAHGGPTFTDNQIAKAVAELTPVALAIVWSIWQKYHGRLKLLTALASPQTMSEKQVELAVATGSSPAVNTPKTDVPSF